METQYGAVINFIIPSFTERGIPIPHYFYYKKEEDTDHLSQKYVNDLFYDYSVRVIGRDPNIIGARYNAYLKKLTPNGYKHFLYELNKRPDIIKCVTIPMAMQYVVAGKRTRYGAGLAGEPNAVRAQAKRIMIEPTSLPSYRARAAAAGAAASAILNPTQGIKRTGELKGLDTALTLSPVLATTNTNGSIFVLNLIQQGAGFWQRIGKKIYPKSVRVKGTVQAVITLADGNPRGNVLRGVLVWDKQPSGNAIPNFNDIFGTVDQTGTEASTFSAALAPKNTDRFKTLKEFNIEFNSGDGGSGLATNFTEVKAYVDEFYKFKKRDNFETQYLSTANPMTIANISSGALYMVFRAEENSNVTTFCEINPDCTAKLRYYD